MDKEAKNGVAGLVIAGIVLLGLIGSCQPEKKNTDGTYSTPWCDAHKNDRDATAADVKRYIHECLGR